MRVYVIGMRALGTFANHAARDLAGPLASAFRTACQIVLLLLLSGQLVPLKSQETVRVSTLRADPGEKVSGHLAVTLADGRNLDLPVSIVNGTKPGPILALVAGEHGTEYTPILALQQLLLQVEPRDMEGALILVHIANPPAFFARRLAEGDPDDLAGRFPGDPNGTTSERIAWVLSEHVIKLATHVVNMHAGGAHETLHSYAYVVLTGDSALDEATRRLALSYGKDRFVIEPNLPADTAGLRFHLDTYAVSLGKPAFTPESGGLGTSDGHYVNAHLAGVQSAMAGLEMIEGTVLRPGRVTWFDGGISIRVNQDGLWQPKISIGDVVQEGDLLGHVLDSFGRVLEEVRSSARGEVLSFSGTPPIIVGETVVFLGRLQ